MGIARLVSTLITFYSYIILAYVLMSWFRPSGALMDIYRALGALAEPYLSLFRRLIPASGGIDFSPMIALIVLQLVGNAIASALLQF